MLNIIINTTSLLSKLTGVGMYALNISRKLAELHSDDEYKYYYGYVSKKLIDNSGSEQKKCFKSLKKLVGEIPCGRSLLKRFRDYVQLRNFDVYFEPNFVPFLPVSSKNTVTTVHDLSFLQKDWVPNDRYEYFRKIFLNTIYKSDFIITPSEYIRNEVLEYLKFDSERVITIHHGIDHNVFNLKQNAKERNSFCMNEKLSRRAVSSKRQDLIRNLPDNYLLFVGSIQPRKNVFGLIKAYLSLPLFLRKDYKLLLVGFESWKSKDVSDIIKNHENDILIIDSAESEFDLAEIYRRSTALVFPTFYEGFGFTPLEAMACGCPVLVSNTSSLPEICGDSAHYIDPHSIESIAEGMFNLLTDEKLREELIRKGLERVRLFNWEESARKHHEVFHAAPDNILSTVGISTAKTLLGYRPEHNFENETQLDSIASLKFKIEKVVNKGKK